MASKYENMTGYTPEMKGMRKNWDRDEATKRLPGLVTGDRAHYKASTPGLCKCGNYTDRVINYLGRLEFICVYFPCSPLGEYRETKENEI